ncbi:hypothetical protein [uncultured Enterovirga sp.]|uniref:hypothetical protein n=1 Tax=uncultured Enterovirga sp. TaxID=2026352 RepID=UPI0035C95E8E
MTMLAAAASCATPTPARAQPEPSVRATCADLREKLARLPPHDDEVVVTIQVEGEVVAARKDDAVAYVVICRPPDAQVACITYNIEERAVGDRVIVAGAYGPVSPDRIVLDPCLHFDAQSNK